MSIYIALYKRSQRFTMKTKQYTHGIIQSIYTMTNEKNQYLGNKCVFNWLLKAVTDGASLMLIGS